MKGVVCLGCSIPLPLFGEAGVVLVSTSDVILGLSQATAMGAQL